MTAKVFPGKIKNCTHCGSPLHRIHRNAFDKLINYLIAINRYSCSNHECGFNGLKISKKPKKRRVSNTSVKKKFNDRSVNYFNADWLVFSNQYFY